MKLNDEKGKRYNSWTVVGYSHQDTRRHNYVIAQCDCGAVHSVAISALRTGRSQQCKSCSGKKTAIKYHGNQGKDLYFIRCGEYIKIGTSDNVPRRLRDLQVANPQKLELLCTLEGQGHLEQEFHRLFDYQKVRGEWFDFSGPSFGSSADNFAENILAGLPQSSRLLRSQASRQHRNL